MCKYSRICTAGILLLMISCMWISGCQSWEKHELLKGDMAPDFTVELLDGNSFTLSKQKGKVVLLNFWATFCSPCVEEMPAFERLYKEYGDQIKIVAINSGENKKTVEKFIKEKNYTFPIGYDGKNEVSSKYQSVGIPYTLIIGRDGSVDEVFIGADKAEAQYNTYRRALKEAFAKE